MKFNELTKNIIDGNDLIFKGIRFSMFLIFAIISLWQKIIIIMYIFLDDTMGVTYEIYVLIELFVYIYNTSFRQTDDCEIWNNSNLRLLLPVAVVINAK